MNKNHLVLLVTGFGGCVALTMMMGHLLSLQPDLHARDPVARIFSVRFAPKLRKPPVLAIHVVEGNVGTRVDLVAKVEPKATTDIDRLLMQMNSFLRSSKFEAGPVRTVTVRWKDPHTGVVSQARMQPTRQRQVLRPHADPRARRVPGAPQRR